MSIGIYKITNLVNGKSYVGQSINIETRFKKHLNTKDDFVIHKAIQKYGKENFTLQILEECNKDELDEREIYWIEKSNTLIPNGYNMIPGGSNHVGRDKSKPVEQFSLGGTFIAEYSSAAEASRVTGVIHSDICKCCRDMTNTYTAGKFQWRYKNSDKVIKHIQMRTEFTIYQLSLDGEKYNK